MIDANLRRLEKHGRRLRHDAGPEDVHDARVAGRRIRAALDVFAASFRRRRAARLKRGLRRAGRRLGTVRDLDVLLAALADFTSGMEATERAEASGLASLAEAWRCERDAATRRLQDELASKRHRRLIRDLAEFAAEARSPDEGTGHADPPVGVRAGAGSRVLAAYEQVEAFDIDPAAADVATLHRLRIAGKRLRYALEAFEEVLDPAVGALREQVVALQDDAGKLHDAVVAAEKARAFAARLGADGDRDGDAHDGDAHDGDGDRDRDRDGVDAPGRRASVAGFAASCDAEVERRRRALADRLPALTGPQFRRELCRVAVAR